MNERIKELFHESIEDCDGTMKGRVYSLKQSEIEKFAELIVRECVSKCEVVANMATITNTGEMARKTKATADSCATMIKEHFGVEE